MLSFRCCDMWVSLYSNNVLDLFGNFYLSDYFNVNVFGIVYESYF